MLERKKLFNAGGDDSLQAQKIVGGNSTGILNLNNVRYSWVKPLFRKMLGDFWIPEKVSLVEDKVSVKNLTKEEDIAVRNTLSFLIFLDSIQVTNLPNIANYVTDPAISNLLGVHDFQEIIHAQSYQYILEGLYPNSEREDIYNLWRSNKLLLERNQFIAEQYEMFLDNPTEENFKRVLVANFLLEGIYFYSGFNLFEQLASRHKLVQTAKVIAYIKVDEGNHLAVFTNLINDLMDTQAEADWIIPMVQKAVEQEIAWGQQIYGDGILGISKKSTEQHIKFLGNRRLRALRLPEVFGEVMNPYLHLESQGNKRENFFETTVTSYSKSEAVDGWDEF
jgi:ribonucleoside-diphosphate reductase beta chain